MRWIAPVPALLTFLVLATTTVTAQNPNYVMSLTSAAGGIGGTAIVNVNLDFPNALDPIAGWNLGVCDDERVDLVAVNPGLTNLQLDPVFEGISTFPGAGWTVGVLISFNPNNSLAPGSGYQLHRATYSLLEEGLSEVALCNSLGSPPVPTDVTLPSQLAVVPVTVNATIDIGLFAPFVLRMLGSESAPGAVASVGVVLDNPVAADAFGFGVMHDPVLLDVGSVVPGGALLPLNGGSGPDFFAGQIDPSGVEGVLIGCIVSFGPVFDTLPAAALGSPNEVARIDYIVSATAADGESAALTFTSELGDPGVPVAISVEGVSVVPSFENAAVDIAGPGGVSFVRGDANSDGVVELVDAIVLLGWLFGTGPAGSCADAADINDDGQLSGLNDGIALLNYLFTGGALPAAPNACGGVDPTDDRLDCETSFCTQ